MERVFWIAADYLTHWKLSSLTEFKNAYPNVSPEDQRDFQSSILGNVFTASVFNPQSTN